MATQAERLEIARLSHRFGFGPRPGEFDAALKIGVSAYRIEATTVPAIGVGELISFLVNSYRLVLPLHNGARWIYARICF